MARHRIFIFLDGGAERLCKNTLPTLITRLITHPPSTIDSQWFHQTALTIDSIARFLLVQGQKFACRSLAGAAALRSRASGPSSKGSLTLAAGPAYSIASSLLDMSMREYRPSLAAGPWLYVYVYACVRMRIQSIQSATAGPVLLLARFKIYTILCELDAMTVGVMIFMYVNRFGSVVFGSLLYPQEDYAFGSEKIASV